MSKWEFTKGLHDLGNGNYAYIQPPGQWGLSNAGLIVDGDSSLLVDTLYDLELTREMLEAMKAATPAAGTIDVLVNTHSNGDHWFGNELVKGAEIISSKICAEEMPMMPPQMMADLVKAAPTLGDLGVYFSEGFSRFNFEDINPTLPTRTFEGSLDIKVGSKDVKLIEVGPCHTGGDVLVVVPEDRVIYAGDLIFHESTPLMWDGPVSNWLKALDIMASFNPEVVVPGHGPIADAGCFDQTRAYWEYVAAEARKRYDAGMTALEAAKDIDLSPFATWGDAERIIINVDSMYREFAGKEEKTSPLELFTHMAEMVKK